MDLERRMERRMHINELELLALILALETFLKTQGIESLHILMDKIVVLNYSLKMECTNNLQMVCLSKQIWEHLLNRHAGIESRRKTDSSEWKLAASVFQRPCVKMGKPLIDLFATRVSHQCPTYVAWRKDVYSVATNSFSITNSTVFEQDKKRQDKKNSFDNIMLVDIVVVPQNTEHVDMETSNPCIIRKTTNQSFRTYSTSCNKSKPYISGKDVFGEHLFEKGVSVKAANLISISRGQSSLLGYDSSWKKWSGWCNQRAVVSCRCTLVSILDYLT